MVSTLSCIIKL